MHDRGCHHRHMVNTSGEWIWRVYSKMASTLPRKYSEPQNFSSKYFLFCRLISHSLLFCTFSIFLTLLIIYLALVRSLCQSESAGTDLPLTMAVPPWICPICLKMQVTVLLCWPNSGSFSLAKWPKPKF